MLGLVGPSLGVATNVGKVVTRLQSLRAVSEESELLWRALESIDGALQLAVCLQKRHRSLHLFDGAVRLTHGTIEACERVLASDEGEADLPSSRDGWIAWLGRQKQGMRRQDALPRLTARLGVCTSSLQLAFAALGALQPPLWSTPGGLRQPFFLIAEAVEQARSAVQEFEMGRRKRLLGCMGRLYTRSLSAVDGRAGEWDWTAGDVHTLCLELQAGEEYRLCLRPAPQTVGLDGDGAAGAKPSASEISLAMGARPLCISRRWLGDVPGLHPHDRGAAFAFDQPAYLFEPSGAAAYALLFEVPSLSLDDEEGCRPRPLSAEAFEAVLAMLQLKGGREDGRHCLAHVCELDTEAGLERFRASLAQLVGPYARSAEFGCGGGATAPLSEMMGRVSLGP